MIGYVDRPMSSVYCDIKRYQMCNWSLTLIRHGRPSCWYYCNSWQDLDNNLFRCIRTFTLCKNALLLASSPFILNETIPPNPLHCFLANSCWGCEGRPVQCNRKQKWQALYVLSDHSYTKIMQQWWTSILPVIFFILIRYVSQLTYKSAIFLAIKIQY